MAFREAWLNTLALKACFVRLEENPRDFLRTKKLKGYENLYRYQVGGLRVVYEIHEDKEEIAVVAIFPRGDVYKKL
ncbi:MAG: type II toxin-antitoxin system RelE/ParE family toxin [Candidatus Omnitrophica bacterium]|nr:type II toxin-antitoxin system RelE/ParE family toxin [Candidatus Omnitrophota bacterium]